MFLQYFFPVNRLQGELKNDAGIFVNKKPDKPKDMGLDPAGSLISTSLPSQNSINLLF